MKNVKILPVLLFSLLTILVVLLAEQEPKIYSDIPDHTVPVVKLTIDNDYLWDKEIGLFSDGVAFGKKRGPEWERAATLEMYDDEKHKMVNQDVLVALQGESSRHNAQKPLEVCVLNGAQPFEYKFFDEDELTTHTCFILRTSGNDWTYTYVRDVLIHTLVSKRSSLDTQASFPVVVYINDEYYGMYNFREKLDENYLAHKYDGRPKDFVIGSPNLIKGKDEPEHVVIKGVEEDIQNYEEMVALLEKEDINQASTYSRVQEYIDINNYIDYIVAEIYAGNQDWPLRNVRFWRVRTSEYDPTAPDGLDGRWRWFFYDLDMSFGMTGGTTRGERTYLPPSSGLFFRLKGKVPIQFLIDNEEFREKFIIRFADLLNSSFNGELVEETIEELVKVYEPEMSQHLNRWEGEHDSGLVNVPESVDEWKEHVKQLKDFGSKRDKETLNHIQEYFKLSKPHEISISINDVGGGSFQVNTISIKKDEWKGIYFSEIPIQLTALPEFGYDFVEWTGDVEGNEESITVDLEKNMKIKAHFEQNTLGKMLEMVGFYEK